MKRLTLLLIALLFAAPVEAGIKYSYSPSSSSSAPEGTAVLSTGETGGTKFLGEDGDGTSSWKTVSAGISNVVEDTTPQLGGSLDVNGNKIVSVSNGNIDIEPNGTGNVLLGNFTFNADQTVGAGQDNYVMTYDNSAGTIGLEAAAGGGIGGSTGATDNAVLRADGTGGSTVQNSLLTVADTTGLLTTGASGQDSGLYFTDDYTSTSNGQIQWDESENSLVFLNYGVNDGASTYASTLTLRATGNTRPGMLWVQGTNSSSTGMVLAGSDFNYSYISSVGSNPAGLFFHQTGSYISPYKHATTFAGGPNGFSNNQIELGQDASRFKNIYSVLGNFSGAITAPGGIVTTSAGSTNIGDATNYFNNVWGKTFWAYNGSNWVNMSHSGSYAYFQTNDGPFYFNDSIVLGASGETLNFTLLGDINLGSDLGGKLNIDGTKDEKQLWVQGHSTQTNNIALFEKSDGTDLVAVTNGGLLLTPITVSALGTATAGRVNMVSDAADATDCTTGAGSTYNLCIANGSAWIDA